MGAVLQIGDADYEEEVTQSKIPVLVDLYAPWCGPCQTISRVLERLVPKYSGRVKIVKVNIDNNPRLKRQFSVQSIPRLVLIVDGKKVGDILGAVPQAKIESELDKHAGTESGLGNEERAGENPLDALIRPANGR